ncbi:MAG TPA: GNAT family N-acetyltransferase [Casimicrobiaceae bacterium]|nr:GNAT family N-acetyltransferase [Casimicrobiaceae bacterium]
MSNVIAGPIPIRSTARLVLREFATDDVDDIHSLDSDPRVMTYVGDGSVASREDAEKTIERVLARYREFPNLGAWHASRRDTGRFIGWVSLKHPGESSDIEIGYRLRPFAWGQGFATELAAAMRDRGFGPLNLKRIIGVTHPDNAASQRVLTKIGMHDEGWGHYYDKDLRLFAIGREAWRGSSKT